MTEIKIKNGGARPAAPDLYGLFFEDINRAGDSGLYPEMLRNRSFEDSIIPKECAEDTDGSYFTTKEGFREQFFHGEGTEKWEASAPFTPIPAWYAENAEMELLREDTLNKNREAALKVRFGENGSIRNIGYRGVPAEKGKPVHFYAFWKAESDCAVSVSIVGKDGKTLASEKAEVKCGDYARCDLRLIPCADDFDASLAIAADSPAVVTIGFTSLMPEDTYMGHGLRRDLVELLRATHSKFMRYPGGCIVEGLNLDTALRFTDTVGPVCERPSKWNLWHYRNTNGFGFHEYLQLCEDLGMEALYVVNCGMTCQGRCPEFLDGEEFDELLYQALSALEYAMGGTDTRWGALRAEMGHPAPFKVKYVEIGNENDGPEYDKRYQIYYKALHEAYPDVILISNAHTETRGLETQYVDEHYYSDWQYFSQSGHLYDRYTPDSPKIFIGEYAVTRGEDVGTLHSALAETRFILGAENNPEIVKLASYAPLFENIYYKSWNPNLISFDNHRACALPFLHALGMLGESRGTEILEVETESELLCPVKYGFAGFISYKPGLRMKMPEADGEACRVCKEVVGHFVEDGGELIADDTGNEALDSVTRYPVQLPMANGVFTARKKTCGEYTYRVFIDENTPKFAMTVWVHNTTEPGIYNLYPDENAPAGSIQPKKVWNLTDTEYYTWTVENGQGQCCYLYRYQEHPLTEKIPLLLRYGGYNEFTIKTAEKGYDCYLNGEFICHAQDRQYGRVEAFASADEETLYIKVLNNSDKAESAEIKLPCSVKNDYSYKLLTGEKTAKNTLDNPENVSAVSGVGTASDGRILWEAPAWSFAVLKIRKS